MYTRVGNYTFEELHKLDKPIDTDTIIQSNKELEYQYQNQVLDNKNLEEELYHKDLLIKSMIQVLNNNTHARVIKREIKLLLDNSYADNLPTLD